MNVTLDYLMYIGDKLPIIALLVGTIVLMFFVKDRLIPIVNILIVLVLLTDALFSNVIGIGDLAVFIIIIAYDIYVINEIGV